MIIRNKSAINNGHDESALCQQQYNNALTIYFIYSTWYFRNDTVLYAYVCDLGILNEEKIWTHRKSKIWKKKKLGNNINLAKKVQLKSKYISKGCNTEKQFQIVVQDKLFCWKILFFSEEWVTFGSWECN